MHHSVSELGLEREASRLAYERSQLAEDQKTLRSRASLRGPSALALQGWEEAGAESPKGSFLQWVPIVLPTFPALFYPSICLWSYSLFQAQEPGTLSRHFPDSDQHL